MNAEGYQAWRDFCVKRGNFYTAGSYTWVKDYQLCKKHAENGYVRAQVYMATFKLLHGDRHDR